MQLEEIIARLKPGNDWQVDIFDTPDAPLRWHPLESWGHIASDPDWPGQRIAALLAANPGHTHRMHLWTVRQANLWPDESWLIPSLTDYPQWTENPLGLPVAELTRDQVGSVHVAGSVAPGRQSNQEETGEELRHLMATMATPHPSQDVGTALTAAAVMLTYAVELASKHAQSAHGTDDWTECEYAALAVQIPASAFVAIYASKEGMRWINRPE